MKRFIIYGLLAIGIGGLAGMIGGSGIEDLGHPVDLSELFYRNIDVLAGLADFDIVGIGASDHFVAGAAGGFVGFVGFRLRGAYAAAYGDAAARDNCGRGLGGGIVFAVLLAFAVIVTTGDLGFITVAGTFAAAIGGCAVGAAVGAV